MRVTVSYHVRDVYDVPDEVWQEATAMCGNGEDGAFDFLISEPEEYPYKTDVTDRYVEAVKEV
jgi:hypothetical protein